MTHRPADKRFDIADSAMLAVVTVWAANNIIVKNALNQIDPVAYVFGRFTIVSVALFALLNVRKVPMSMRREDLPLFLFTGITGYAVYNLLTTVALAHTSAFSAALLVSLGPVITILFAAALGMERIRPAQWVGIVVSTIGVVIFVGEKLAGGTPVLGDLLAIAGAVCFSAYSLATQPLVRRYGSPVVTAWSVFIGLLFVIPISFPALADQDWRSIDPSGWSSLLYSSLIAMLFAYTVWAWAIERRGVARTVPFLYMIPVLAGIFSALFLDETFGFMKVLGGALVFVGIALARRAARKGTTAITPSAGRVPATADSRS